MKKKTLFLGILVLTAGSALAHETGTMPAGDRYPPTSAPASAPPPIVVLPPGPVSSRPVMSDDAKFATMDANSNGSLSKSEVSVSSELTTRFRALDRNHDGKLSRSEYGKRNVDTSSR